MKYNTYLGNQPIEGSEWQCLLAGGFFSLIPAYFGIMLSLDAMAHFKWGYYEGEFVIKKGIINYLSRPHIKTALITVGVLALIAGGAYAGYRIVNHLQTEGHNKLRAERKKQFEGYINQANLQKLYQEFQTTDLNH